MRWLSRHRGLALWVLMAGFAFGLVRLFALRADVGDLYPPYSSLRRDPQGTAVLFESLKSLPGVTVRRNFEPLDSVAVEGPATLLVLGVSGGGFPGRFHPGVLFDRLESRGGRLVIAFAPRTIPESAHGAGGDRIAARAEEGEAAAARGPDIARRTASQAVKPEPLERILADRLGLRVVIDSVPRASGDPKDVSPPEREAHADGDFPGSFASRGFIRLEPLDPSWKVLAHVRGDPVAVERRLGQAGCVVVAADSSLFSNEALSRRRRSAFLARMIGPRGEIVFEETHLGLVERPTIAELIRRHGFHGFLITAAAIVLLAVWQRAAPLVPEPGGAGPAGRDPQPRDAVNGWESLLRRHIGRREILALCLDEWARSAGRDLPHAAEALEPIRAEARRAADPAAGYRRVGERLRELTASRSLQRNTP